MTNPQLENGYTSISNELIEALAGIRISGEARQCLDVIFRKTYGFHKKEDLISLSQFSLLTKMPKATVCRALHKLAKMNIIIDKNDNGNGKIYAVNKDYSSWKSLTKKIIVDKKDNGRYQKRQFSLTKMGNTKDSIKRNYYKRKYMCIEDFDKFWEAYPTKKDKSKAREKFLRLEASLLQTILEAIENQKKEKVALKERKEFCPEWKHPTTWINGKCWEDEVKDAEKPKPIEDDDWTKINL